MHTLIALLHLPHGDAWQRLYAFLPWWLLGTLALTLVAVVTWRLVGYRILAVWPAAATPIATLRGAAGLIVVCGVIIAACDGSALTHGFFRQDDFSFLQTTRESENVGRQMLLIHNDHGMPLYRLQVWLAMKCAGPHADSASLAGWFNGLNFLACLSLLLAGGWVLHELGGSRAGLLAFAFFTWMWPGWGEFTAGFYTLSVYIQVQALSLAAAAALLRGSRSNRTPWLALSLLFAMTAAGLDTTGVHVIAALALLCAAALWPRQHPSLRRRYLFVLGLLLVTVCTFYFLLGSHTRVARELVQNPGAHTLGAARLMANLPLLPAACLTAVIALPGLLLSLVTPTFLQLVVTGEKVGTALFCAFAAVQSLMLVALVIFGWRFWRRLQPRDQLIGLALVANAVLGLIMVMAARTSYAVWVPVPLWHSKYLVMPVTWLLLAITFGLDRLWFSQTRPAARIPGTLFAAVVAGIWLIASVWHAERSLLPQPLAYVARGRWGNLSVAVERVAQYRAVLADLAAIAARRQTHLPALPKPGPWSEVFYERYPLLEWGGDYTARGVTHLFWDMPAASPDLGLNGRWEPAEKFSPASRAELTRYPWLAPAFASSEQSVSATAAAPDRSPKP